MPIQFPSSASINDVYTYATHSWIWNGKGWQLDPAAYIGSGFTFSTTIGYMTNIFQPSPLSFFKAP